MFETPNLQYCAILLNFCIFGIVHFPLVAIGWEIVPGICSQLGGNTHDHCSAPGSAPPPCVPSKAHHCRLFLSLFFFRCRQPRPTAPRNARMGSSTRSCTGSVPVNQSALPAHSGRCARLAPQGLGWCGVRAQIFRIGLLQKIGPAKLHDHFEILRDRVLP